MPQARHIGLSCKRLVVFIFLLLNCLLTAAPFANASSAAEPVETGYLTQHQSSDQEENNPVKRSLEDRVEYNHVARNKQRVAANASTITQVSLVNVISSAPPAQTAGSGFRLRPAYYCLLFLYQLF